MTGFARALRGVVLLLLAVGAAHAQDDVPAEGQGTAAHDHHATHRAAMSRPRYSVTTEHYAVPDVELVDASGARVALRPLLAGDEPVALNFIFTSCTTICPVMTATFARMRRELGDAGARVRLVSVSIDPEYDRPAALSEYASQFGASDGWTFLTGDSGDVAEVLRSFDAYWGSKMNHRPVTLLKRPGSEDWFRVDGLASGEQLAGEVAERLLN